MSIYKKLNSCKWANIIRNITVGIKLVTNIYYSELQR